jgi:phenylacetic acid degradation operon negative regulatory protein
MKARTELILYQCLWMVDTMMRPTWRNMTGSFEEWAYHNGFLRQMQALERQGWLESREGSDGTERVYRLTRKGYLRALGGCDPAERWNRGWDGKWRMVVFDLPEKQRGLRNELRKQLRTARFGGLQGSVWISPDPVHVIGEQLKKLASSCGVMTFFEGMTCCGESASELVAAAWDFEKIHDSYQDYMAFLKQVPRTERPRSRDNLLEWGCREKQLWSLCLEADPLLPRELWLGGYPGEKAWKARVQVLRRVGKLANKDLTNY